MKEVKPRSWKEVTKNTKQVEKDYSNVMMDAKHYKNVKGNSTNTLLRERYST